MTEVTERTEETRVFAGLAEADLPKVVARSDRLFFHAALYANFARNPVMAHALETALARPGFRSLEVVSLDVTAAPVWKNEFFAVLRQDMFPGDLEKEFAVSDAFLADLARRHPDRVRLYRTALMPLAPIVLVDDAIYAGHYAHGPIPAPDGLWLAVAADVPRLLRLAEADIPPGDRLTRAAYRFVRECVIARDRGTRVICRSPLECRHARA